MAGDDVVLRRVAHIGADQVGRAHGAVEQNGFARRPIVAHGGLDQRAVVVEVVLDHNVAAVFAPAPVGRFQQRPGGEEAVRDQRGRAHALYDSVNARPQRHIGPRREEIARAPERLH